MTTSLAISPCPNDTFVFHAWIHGLVDGAPGVDVTFADIDVANGFAMRATHDVVKISCAALPYVLDDYALLPTGGAVGRGCGPLLVAASDAIDVEDIAGLRIAIPGEHTTAYLLMRLWLDGRIHDDVKIEVIPFDRIMPAVQDGEYDAGLIIHESRFTYPSYGLHAVIDLGEWWEGTTGLEIPLGAIVARRSLDTAQLSSVIRESVEYAWRHPEASREFVRAHAQEIEPAVIAAHIDLYVNDRTRELGDEGYAAAEELLNRAARQGLVPPLARKLR